MTGQKNRQAIARPVAPKVLAQLDEWAGEVDSELDVADCTVQGGDFSDAKRLEIEGCKLTGIQFAGAKFDKLQISDTVLSRTEASGIRAPETAWLRTEAKDNRMTGADFGAASFEDCRFENVKFDEAGFRFATFKRVQFENCVLRNADFSGAKFSHITFTGCDVEGANFDNANCKLVDLRGEDLSGIKGILGLKGATISSDQLIQLAPLLAAELGFNIDYET